MPLRNSVVGVVRVQFAPKSPVLTMVPLVPTAHTVYSSTPHTRSNDSVGTPDVCGVQPVPSLYRIRPAPPTAYIALDDVPQMSNRVSGTPLAGPSLQ